MRDRSERDWGSNASFGCDFSSVLLILKRTRYMFCYRAAWLFRKWGVMILLASCTVVDISRVHWASWSLPDRKILPLFSGSSRVPRLNLILNWVFLTIHHHLIRRLRTYHEAVQICGSCIELIFLSTEHCVQISSARRLVFGKFEKAPNVPAQYCELSFALRYHHWIYFILNSVRVG